jgi:superfamily I DNA and/or RNA helicase
MKESRRMNVMLTRCKKGMMILTSRSFIEGKASPSLVGRLAKTLGAQGWLDLGTVQRGDFHPFST